LIYGVETLSKFYTICAKKKYHLKDEMKLVSDLLPKAEDYTNYMIGVVGQKSTNATSNSC